MATDATRDGRDPANMAPRDVLQVAVGHGQAIHCTTAHGRVTRFVPVPLACDHGPEWVARDEPDEKGAVVTEAHVRNAVRRCQPDVRWVDR